MMLKRLFCFWMVMGALLGLFAQTAAVAMGPAIVSSHAVTTVQASADTDCSKMAPANDEGTKPCKGLTLACMAQMGCAIPMTLEEPARVAGVAIAPMPATWPVILTRAGRSVAPELRPPSYLS